VNSLFLRITNTVTYLLTVIVTSLTNCYHKTSINKTVKLHVPSSVVLEIENVNASLEMGHCQKKVTRYLRY